MRLRLGGRARCGVRAGGFRHTGIKGGGGEASCSYSPPSCGLGELAAAHAEGGDRADDEGA